MKRLSLLLLFSCAVLSTAIAQELGKKSLSVVSMKSQGLAEAPKQVYINNFKVYYQMIAEAQKTVYGGRQLGGGSYTGNATAKLAVGVEGLQAEDLQELTDKIYADYIESLKSRGFEIRTARDMESIPFYTEHLKLDGPRINQEQVEGSLMVIPTPFSYYVQKVSKKGKEKSGGFMGAVSNQNDFTSAIYHKGLPKISQDLNDAVVIDIAINVPSIYLDPKSKLGTAKVKGGPYLRVQSARATYASGKGNKPGAAYPEAAVEVLLTQPLVINGVFASEEFKAVADKKRTSVPSYAAFFTVEDTSVELTNTIECDAGVYKEKVSNAVKIFLDASLEKFDMGLAGEKAK
ncbi:hypothetical protein [uncultured Draconibacterium sp.]|uniref:hypothetical protein n=1 Tax=uncultured Draconibacterium sp. TaxID=1573823 RepID=UPI003260396F